MNDDGHATADPPRFLFTYGTLAPGSPVPAAQLLATHAHVVAPAEVSGSLYRGGGWPAWHPEGAGPVHGTLWRLPDEERIRHALLSALDRYEGVDPDAPARSLFVREAVVARTANDTHRAWIYRYARAVRDLDRIPEGRWTSTVLFHR